MLTGPVDRLGADRAGLSPEARSSMESVRELSMNAIFFESGDQDGPLVEPGALERVRLRVALAVLRADGEGVLAGGVGEIGDRSCRRATRSGERSWAPAVRVRLRTSPFLAGTVTTSPRNSNTARLPVGEMSADRTNFDAVGEPRARLDQVGRDADLEPRRISQDFGSKTQSSPRLLVDDLPRAGGRGLDREVVVVGQPPRPLSTPDRTRTG